MPAVRETSKNDEKTSLLLINPTVIKGPVIKMTVADLLKCSPKIFISYHAMGTAYAFLSPLGLVIGCVVHVTHLYRPFPSIMQTMTTGSLVAGCAGLAVGALALGNAAWKGDNLTPVPWNEEGIQDRIDRMSHNYKNRVLDLSVWSGIVAAAAAVAIAGGPANLPNFISLSSGIYGTVQALQFGAATGSILGIGLITREQRKTARMIADSA